MRASRSLPRLCLGVLLVAALSVGVSAGCGGTTGREFDGIEEIPGIERPDGATVVTASAEAGDDARRARRDAMSDGPTSRDGGGQDASTGGPVCGNGAKEGKEECDDGNALDGDGCSSFCTDMKTCDACLKANCPAPDYAFPPCKGVDGNATDGPSAGDSKAALCRAVYACVLRTRCAVTSLTDCYCGSAAGAGCLTPRAANGACKKEIESGLESTEPATVATGFTDANLGGGVALLLLQCAQDSCATECRHP